MRRRVRVYSAAADMPPVRTARWVALAFGGPLLAVAWILAVVLQVVAIPPAAPADSAVTALRGALVVGLPVLAVVVGGYGYWRARLEVFAGRPGPIVVAPFVDRTSTGTDGVATGDTALAAELTASFQRALVRTRIYGSTAIPSTGGSADFLQVVEQAGEKGSGFWAALARFARVLAPVSTYRVTGELLVETDDGGPDPARPYVLLVGLTRAPVSSIAPTTIREATWEQAVERAAHVVAAVVLPRTRRCRMPPWTPWRGLRLPVGLFDLYQRFQAHRGERGYDEAMGALREALRRDPGNLALRLEMGKLQEQQDMHLDALLTYDDIVSLASRRDAALSRWWNPTRRGVDDWSDTPRAPGYSTGHPVVQVARYRHAVLLGLGEKLAAQWWDRPPRCPGQHRTTRERRREYLRRTLAARFHDRYGPVADDLEARGLVRRPRARYLRADLGSKKQHRRRARAEDLRVFFTTVSVLELERLRSDRHRYRLSDLARPARRRVLPRRALDLIVVWACLRRAMALSHAHRAAPDRVAKVRVATSSLLDAGGSAIGDHDSALLGKGWPASTEALTSVVERILRSRRGVLRSWLEHYSAACVHSLVLLPEDPYDTTRSTAGPTTAQERPAVRAALAELSRAVACSDSGYLGSQRDWVLTEDPDLDHLRGRDEFRDFEAITFGSVRRAERRGPRLVAWEQTAHVAAFVSALGAEVARLWARRAAQLDRGEVPSWRAVRRWIDEEVEGWLLAERLALDHRDWAVRVEVARTVGSWMDREGLEPVGLPHWRFSDRRVARQADSLRGHSRIGPVTGPLEEDGSVARQVAHTIAFANERVESLAESLRADVGDACCSLSGRFVLDQEVEALRSALRETAVGAPPPTALVLTSWCRRESARWSALADWFDDTVLHGLPVEDRRRRFRALLGHVEAVPEQRIDEVDGTPGTAVPHPAGR